ncbi:hypothetical protein HDU96_005580 [Phlyctochytrium bullatum]|nr:hypothetical protein HDU96_005580 [Phlyctochytrium bullatum]
MSSFKTKENMLTDTLHEITQNLRRISSRITLEGVVITDFRENHPLIESLATKKVLDLELDRDRKTLPSPAQLRKIFASIKASLAVQEKVLSNPSGASSHEQGARWNEVIEEDIARISNIMDDIEEWYWRLSANEMLSVKQDLLRHWTLKLKDSASTESSNRLLSSLGGTLMDSTLLDDFLSPTYQQALMKMATINSRMASLTALQNMVARAWVAKNRSVPVWPSVPYIGVLIALQDTAYGNGDVPPSVRNAAPNTQSSKTAKVESEFTDNSSQTAAVESSESNTQTVAVTVKDAETSAADPETVKAKDHDEEPNRETSKSRNPEAKLESQDAEAQTEINLVESMVQTDVLREDTGRADLMKEVETPISKAVTVAESSVQTEVLEDAVVGPDSSAEKSIAPKGNTMPAQKEEEPAGSQMLLEVRTSISTIKTADGEPFIPNLGKVDLDDKGMRVIEEVVTVKRHIKDNIWDAEKVLALTARLQKAEAEASLLKSLQAEKGASTSVP